MGFRPSPPPPSPRLRHPRPCILVSRTRLPARRVLLVHAGSVRPRHAEHTHARTPTRTRKAAACALVPARRREPSITQATSRIELWCRGAASASLAAHAPVSAGTHGPSGTLGTQPETHGPSGTPCHLRRLRGGGRGRPPLRGRKGAAVVSVWLCFV